MRVEFVDRPPPTDRRRGGGSVPKYDFSKLVVGGKAMKVSELHDMPEVEKVRSALSQYRARSKRQFRTDSEPVKNGSGVEYILWIWRVE